MTNAEKFEEVFGIKVAEYPDDPCNTAHDTYCIHSETCSECRLYHFWSREYIETSKDREDVSKVFTLGALFGFVAGSDDETLSLIEKELKNMEVNKNDSN